MAKTTIFVNGQLVGNTKSTDNVAKPDNCVVIQGSHIVHVGRESDNAVLLAKQSQADIVDLKNRVLVPGFIDSHVHLLFFGLSLQKLDLLNCKSLAEIRHLISEYAKANQDVPRILCKSWNQSSTDGLALATMLDDLDPRPIFIEASDLHSSWCNTAALNELPLDEIKKSCNSDHVPCDADGNPTGLLAETALTTFVWPYLANACSAEEKQEALGMALDAYVQAGYTGVIDMAMDTNAWAVLEQFRGTKGLPVHVGAHWFIPYEQDTEKLLRHADEAIEMHQRWHPSKDPEFCILGVKIISDGVVDGCTAALSYPYGYGEDSNFVKPMWPMEALKIFINRVAEAGLQVAIHAIGDAAITQAVDAIASANCPDARHRIEHLELANEEDAKRLGKLGITASIQPVHSDPAILKGYAKLLQPHHWEGAFPYKELADGNGCVAIGTDAPTAKHLPFPNFYTATTRKSALEPQLDLRTNPNSALSLSQTLTGATYGAAYSRFAETWTGSLKEGLRADLLVLDAKWTPESMLEAQVCQTWFKGNKTFDVATGQIEANSKQIKSQI